MALQKQVVSVPFAHGVDLKTDEKQVLAGKLLLLENGIFTSPGQIKKRNGYDALIKIIEGTALSITSGTGLANFKNEILLLDGTEAYSFSESTTKWSDKQTFTNLSISASQVVRNTYQQTTPDVALHSMGLQVVTYEDSRGGSRYCLIDTITGEQLVTDKLISATAIKPKPFVLGNFLIIFYVDISNNHLRILPIPVLTPLTPFPTQDLATNVNSSNPNYDATAFSTKVYFSYYTNAGAISTSALNAFLTQNAPETVLGQAASSCISITVDSTLGDIWIAYHTGTQVKYFILDNSLPFAPILAPTVIESNSNTIKNISLLASASSGNIYYTQTAALPSNNFVKEAALTKLGVVSGLQVLLRSVSIASKAFLFNSLIYLTVSFDSVLQPTYFTIRTKDAAVVAKFSPGIGGGTPVKNIVPESCRQTYGVYLLGTLQKDLLTTIAGAVYTQTGVNLTTLNFVDAKASKVQLGANLHLTGGILAMYDGVSVVEHNFNIFPENITIASSTTGGGIGAGTREYFVLYTWMDAQGQTHESTSSIGLSNVIATITAPVTFTSTFASGATSITVSSTTGLIAGQVITDTTTPTNLGPNTFITAINGLVLTLNQATQGAGTTDNLQTVDTASNTLTIPTLRITQKKAPIRTPVVIQVYRTIDSQTIGYMVTSVTAPLLNDTTVDTVQFVDTVPDNIAVGNPYIYTTGGVVDNSAAPAFSYVTTYQDRIIGLPEENKNQWWYSKQNIPGSPVEFADIFVNNVDQAGGDLVTALKMDSYLVFFKETLIYYITGTGPDNTGAQNDFSSAQIIASDVGCIDKDSVVLTPAGIFFKSLKGIYLLTRGLGLAYVGAEVELYNNDRVVSANLIENTQQVRFCLDSGIALMYDYYVKEWSIFTNHPAVDSIIYQGEFTYLTANGLVLQETPGKFSDNGEFIKLKLKTAWLSFVGLQAFQRVYKMLFLGTYFDPHNVAVYAAYDFNPFTTQQNVTRAGAILGTGVYGSDSTYGETSPYGGPPQTYQFRVNLNRQKCETIQITIEDQQLGASFGENLALSAFGFEIGAKTGLNKLVAQGSNTPKP